MALKQHSDNIFQYTSETIRSAAWRTWLIGRPLATADAPHQTIGKLVGLAVIDQGIGIPEADLPNVFDKFYRTSRSHGFSGIGLGLSISKGIVEAHGGRMWADNHPSGGAMISLALPIEDADQEESA